MLRRGGMKVNRRKTEHMCVNERQVNGRHSEKARRRGGENGGFQI